MEISQKFGKYLVTLDTDSDGAGTTDCQVSIIIAGKEYFSSLACLDSTGNLTRGGIIHDVDDAIIEKISTWAEANGY